MLEKDKSSYNPKFGRKTKNGKNTSSENLFVVVSTSLQIVE